jgi:hypothetical protein
MCFRFYSHLYYFSDYIVAFVKVICCFYEPSILLHLFKHLCRLLRNSAITLAL